MSPATTSGAPSEALAAIDRRLAEAEARVEQLEREQGAARTALQAAALAIAEGERAGVRASERQKLEDALVEARAAVDDVSLAAKLDGARAALRDRHAERTRYIGANLAALVAPVEADAEIAVDDIRRGCELIVEAFGRREGCATKIGSYLSTVTRPAPGDVGPPSNAEALVREARNVLMQGELAPRLLRDPSQPPRYGQLAEAEQAVA